MVPVVSTAHPRVICAAGRLLRPPRGREPANSATYDNWTPCLYWRGAWNALFVLTTLYLPKGVVGLWAQMKDKFMSSGGGGNSGITTGSSSEKSSDQENSKEAEGNA